MNKNQYLLGVYTTYNYNFHQSALKIEIPPQDSLFNSFRLHKCKLDTNVEKKTQKTLTSK